VISRVKHRVEYIIRQILLSIKLGLFLRLLTCLFCQVGPLELLTPISRCLANLACARIANREQTILNDTKLWVALSRVPELGTVRFRRLEPHFGKLETVWNAGFRDLKAAELEDRPGQEIAVARNNSSLDDEMAALERAGVTAVT
ncbi:uncharacterized protein METZ01_LOCUS10922, partial [marine metagenome]